MRTLPWARSAALASVRSQIWRYVTPSVREEDQLLLAGALLQLRPSEVAVLGRLHFLLSDEVDELLRGVPGLLRRLAVSSREEQEVSNDRILGSIDWPATITARTATVSRTTFVTRPARRAYQTPENEVLVHALDAIIEIARQVGWSGSRSDKGVASEIRRRVREASLATQHRVIEQVERVPPGPRTIARVRSGKRRQDYSAATRAVQLHRSFVRQLDRPAIRESVEKRALATADDPILFELLCFFQLLDVLEARGWSTSPLGLLEGAAHARFRRSDGAILDVWYQTAPRELRLGSRYVAVQSAHGLSNRSDLRPDLVLRLRLGSENRWLLGEIKLGTVRSLQDSARAALHDLFAYRQVFRSVLELQPGTYGLGIAWGEGLTPAAKEEVLLITPDAVGLAIDMWLN